MEAGFLLLGSDSILSLSIARMVQLCGILLDEINGNTLWEVSVTRCHLQRVCLLQYYLLLEK